MEFWGAEWRLRWMVGNFHESLPMLSLVLTRVSTRVMIHSRVGASNILTLRLCTQNVGPTYCCPLFLLSTRPPRPAPYCSNSSHPSRAPYLYKLAADFHRVQALVAQVKPRLRHSVHENVALPLKTAHKEKGGG